MDHQNAPRREPRLCGEMQVGTGPRDFTPCACHLAGPYLPGIPRRRSSPTPRAQTGTPGYPARPWADYLLWMMVTRQTIIVPDGQIGGYASSHDCRVNCSLRSADRRGRSRAPGSAAAGRATDRRPLPARKLAGDYAQFAQTCQDSASGIVDACGPGSPDSHRVVWGLASRPPGSPRGLSSGFPFARRVLPLRPPSSGFPSSGVLRFVPFGRCPVPVPLRCPSGFPSLEQSSR